VAPFLSLPPTSRISFATRKNCSKPRSALSGPNHKYARAWRSVGVARPLRLRGPPKGRRGGLGEPADYHCHCRSKRVRGSPTRSRTPHLKGQANTTGGRHEFPPRSRRRTGACSLSGDGCRVSQATRNDDCRGSITLWDPGVDSARVCAWPRSTRTAWRRPPRAGNRRACPRLDGDVAASAQRIHRGR
jgi:hypothetical protein